MTRREDIRDHWAKCRALEADLGHFLEIWADRGAVAVVKAGDPNNRQGFERYELVWESAKSPAPAVVQAHLSAFNARLQYINVEYWDKVSRWGDEP